MKGGEKVFVSWEEGKDPDNVFSFDVVRYVMWYYPKAQAQLTAWCETANCSTDSS